VTPHSKSLLDRLLAAAIMLAVSAWLLRWAWNEIEPLWPVGLGLAALGTTVMLTVRWRRNRYW
jgi:uncharacterized membrane protein